MGRIIAIGGGNTFKENLKINKHIVQATKKKHPKLLFIPTASGDSERYWELISEHFTKLGCKCDVLHLIREKPTKRSIKEKIAAADIIYVGGGNTLRMMKIWEQQGIKPLIKKAYDKGSIMCGLSAGSICWFRWGNSDSRKFKDKRAPYIRVSALHYVNALHCPHYDAEPKRKPSLKKMMKRTPGVAIALDNCAAIDIKDNTYRILKSKRTAKAYKVFWKSRIFHEQEIPVQKQYLSLESLLHKF